VDRLVAQGLVQRDTAADDRRYLALSLTAEGKALSKRIVAAEEVLHDSIEQLVAGQPVDETITTLRALAAAFPAGEALARRRAAEET
jgi:DNA-binding MarR family transcriptional regulator